MQSVSFTNVTLIDESQESSGRPLWLSLVNRASKLGFNTRILLFIELEKDVSALFVNGQCVNFVDCLRSCKTLPELSKVLQSNANEIGSQKSLLVIDNLTLLSRRFGIDSIAALLFSVGQICPVLSRFQRNPFSDIEQNRLKSIAKTILSLSKNSEDGKQICKTITFKKGGLGIREKIESYEISSETAGITSRSVETKKVAAASTTQNSDFMPCHGGNGGKSSATTSRERVQREKASVVLPYTRAQTEKGLVGLNVNRKKPIGAKIEYFAEKCDDLEDSDPDEELMY
uniref:Elongator complex protein 5 n=1 Tax=Panagrolaimus sp. PS1159 TaxID=55785 RepID=A0AC35F608_9BILA